MRITYRNPDTEAGFVEFTEDLNDSYHRLAADLVARYGIRGANERLTRLSKYLNGILNNHDGVDRLTAADAEVDKPL